MAPHLLQYIPSIKPRGTVNPMLDRPYTTVVLAMSADGKISDAQRSPTLFGSANDKAHLERQVAAADAVLGGAGSLRVGGTAMRVRDSQLIQHRLDNGKPAQPMQIIASASGNIDPTLPFFRQPIPRWLLTTATGAQPWQNQPGFEKILICHTHAGAIAWESALQQIAQAGIEHLAVLGGGQLVGSLVAAGAIDELWLTVCPLLIGGTQAPTPVDGSGFPLQMATRLELLEVTPIEQELFLHYRVRKD
ncbi:RibD family protein [Phormidium sp. CCY1219]|uniref:RibD family protein n=1 Tax=Phormidium sp. CCY1219 TaxID=2886104 RepID=UPI002D76AFC3|nr:RibD family protein [Phormidium sp. CCY1219]